jgi:hypothetical protein
MFKKTTREVETELELPSALPDIVSGHHNHVHLANDAYMAIVGQPACPWLPTERRHVKRGINGIVVLDGRAFGPASRLVNDGSSAFLCTSRIL